MVWTLNKCFLMLVLLFSWLAAYTLFYSPPSIIWSGHFYSPIKNESQTKQDGQLAWASARARSWKPNSGLSKLKGHRAPPLMSITHPTRWRPLKTSYRRRGVDASRMETSYSTDSFIENLRMINALVRTSHTANKDKTACSLCPQVTYLD